MPSLPSIGSGRYAANAILLFTSLFTLHLTEAFALRFPVSAPRQMTTTFHPSSKHDLTFTSTSLFSSTNNSGNNMPAKPSNTNAQRTLSNNLFTVTAVYVTASVALLHKLYAKTTDLANASLYFSTAALTLFNLSIADRKRLMAAQKASEASFSKRDISLAEQVDDAEQQRYAADRFGFAIAMKSLGQILGILRMVVDSAPGGGAAIVMATQIVYFIIGGGKYRHTDEGILSPIEDRLVVGASTTYSVFLISALIVGRAATESVARSVAAGVYALGCFTGAFDGVMSLLFGGAGKSQRGRRRIRQSDAADDDQSWPDSWEVSDF